MNLEIKASISRKTAEIKNGIKEFRNHDFNTKKKILLSAVLSASTLGIAWGAIPVLTTLNQEWIRNFSPVALNNGWATGLSVGVNVACSLVNSNQERRLLEKFDANQDFPQTILHNRLGRINFLKERKTIRSTASVAASAITFFAIGTLVRDSPLLLAVGMERFAAIKTTQGLFNLVQAGVAEVPLRTVGREKKTKRKAKEITIFDSQTITEPKAVVFTSVAKKIESK